MKRIVIELDEEDLDNMPLALGYAVAAIRLRPEARDREFDCRMIARLEALFTALSMAEVSA